jgi:hypothetical protein
MNTLEKEVGYAFPSSDIAKECGFEATGCYFVEVLDGNKTQSILGFATFGQAFNHAWKMPHPFSKHSLREAFR